MTDHPLTDEMCEQIKLHIFNQSDEDCMRVAYNLGKIKGSGEMVAAAIYWLKDNVGGLLLSAESELDHRYLESLEKEFIESFVDAVYPQPFKENNS